MVGIARTIWGDHQRYKETYFSAFPGKYTGDGALRDEVGYYRITGRVDDVVIVSGHNLGTVLSKMLSMNILLLQNQPLWGFLTM
jgi:acyl-coenzyme A synthetase/AMP-(fatty) acid ligase